MPTLNSQRTYYYFLQCPMTHFSDLDLNFHNRHNLTTWNQKVATKSIFLEGISEYNRIQDCQKNAKNVADFRVLLAKIIKSRRL